MKKIAVMLILGLNSSLAALQNLLLTGYLLVAALLLSGLVSLLTLFVHCFPNQSRAVLRELQGRPGLNYFFLRPRSSPLIQCDLLVVIFVAEHHCPWLCGASPVSLPVRRVTSGSELCIQSNTQFCFMFSLFYVFFLFCLFWVL